MNDSLERLIHALPKAELHLHIEGTLDPELMFEIARRNDIALPYASVAEVRAACDFKDLQSFLDLYYAGAAVLIRQRDFYDLTWAYLLRMRDENVRHVEIFFDPQTHTDRGVAFAEVIEGIDQALRDAREQLGISSRLIMCFLRHLSEEAAFKVFRQALPYRDRLAAVGLDSAELGNPPGKFVKVFAAAREAGLPAVVHAGEEGPPHYIREALDLLKAQRIDHGVQCTQDPELVARLRDEQIPLTVCPLSNVKLRVFERLADHNLRALMAAGLLVTINSDDPAYFGGYLTQNFVATAAALDLERDDILTLARNAFTASFLPEAERDAHLAEIERVAARN